MTSVTHSRDLTAGNPEQIIRCEGEDPRNLLPRNLFSRKNVDLLRAIAFPFLKDPKISPRTIHLIDKGEHFFMRVLRKEDPNHVFLIFEPLSDEQRKTTATEEKFDCLEPLHLEEKTGSLQEGRFVIRGYRFIFSDELLLGMGGKRGDDHKISRFLLERCLRKLREKNYVKKASQKKLLTYYFKVKENESFKFLKLVLRRQQGDQFYVVTGFFQNPSIIKREFGLSDQGFSSWSDSILKIDLSMKSK